MRLEFNYFIWQTIAKMDKENLEIFQTTYIFLMCKYIMSKAKIPYFPEEILGK